MIRLGLRLAVAGGREALGRLALIAIAVAIGVAMLLATLAGLNAFDAQNERYAWFLTGDANAGQAPAEATPSDTASISLHRGLLVWASIIWDKF